MKNLKVHLMALSILGLPFMAMADRPVPKQPTSCTQIVSPVANQAKCKSTLRVNQSDIRKLERIIKKDGIVTAREAALLRQYKRQRFRNL